MKESMSDYFEYVPKDFIGEYAVKHGVKKDDIDIMLALLSGKSYQEIADKKDWDIGRVRKRMTFVYEKLKVAPREKGPVKLQRLQQQLLTEHQAKTKGSKDDIEKEKTRPKKMKTENEVVWNGRPDISSFVGREEELKRLTKWILEDKCRLVSILGLKGIGKSFISVKLTEKIKDKFEFVIWRSLSLAPTISAFLDDVINIFITKTKEEEKSVEKSSANVNDKIAILIDKLKEYRCLLVLAEFNTILFNDLSNPQFQENNKRDGKPAGTYRTDQLEYALYSELIQQINEQSELNSCVVITSSECPDNLQGVTIDSSSVKICELGGLKEEDFRELLKVEKNQYQGLAQIIKIYDGHPIAVMSTLSRIQNYYGGDIKKFFEEKTITFKIDSTLKEDFQFLSENERQILYKMVVEEVPLMAKDMEGIANPRLSIEQVIQGLESLQGKFFVTKLEKDGSFQLSSLTKEFIISKLSDRVYSDEILPLIEEFDIYEEKPQTIKNLLLAQVELTPKLKSCFNSESKSDLDIPRTSVLEKISIKLFGYYWNDQEDLLEDLESCLNNLKQLKRSKKDIGHIYENIEALKEYIKKKTE